MRKMAPFRVAHRSLRTPLCPSKSSLGPHRSLQVPQRFPQVPLDPLGPHKSPIDCHRSPIGPHCLPEGPRGRSKFTKGCSQNLLDLNVSLKYFFRSSQVPKRFQKVALRSLYNPICLRIKKVSIGHLKSPYACSSRFLNVTQETKRRLK